MQELIRPKRPLINVMLMAGLDSISKDRSSSPPVSRCDGETEKIDTVIQYVKTVNMDPVCDEITHTFLSPLLLTQQQSGCE